MTIIVYVLLSKYMPNNFRIPLPSSCYLHNKLETTKVHFYKSNLENPSAFKIFSNGLHLSVHPVRKFVAHLRKFWRNMYFPSYSYKKWTLVTNSHTGWEKPQFVSAKCILFLVRKLKFHFIKANHFLKLSEEPSNPRIRLRVCFIRFTDKAFTIYIHKWSIFVSLVNIHLIRFNFCYISIIYHN